MYPIQFIIILCFCSCSFALETLPQFVKVDKPPGNEFDWVDVHSSLQVFFKLEKFKFPEAYEPSIIFNCKVRQLHKNYPIKAAQFCIKKSVDDKTPVCLDATKSVTKAHLMSTPIQYDFEFDKSTGFKVVLNWKNGLIYSVKKGGEGLYYCKIENDRSSSESNFVEIRDYFFYYRKLISQKSFSNVKVNYLPVGQINSTQLPLILPCKDHSTGVVSPSWYHAYRQTFEWNICRTLTDSTWTSPETCKTKGESLTSFIAQENFDVTAAGDLSIRQLPQNKNAIPGMLFCKFDLFQRIYFMYGNWNHDKTEALGPSFNFDIPYTDTVLTAISPISETIVFRKGMVSKDMDEELLVEYKANPNRDSISFKWTKDGRGVPASLIGARPPTANRLTFSKDILEDHTGIYKLTIQQTSPPGKNVLEFTFNIKVVEPPIPLHKELWLPRIFKMKGESLGLVCGFKKANDKKLFINGLPLLRDSQANLDKTLRDIQGKYSWLHGLELSIRPISQFFNTDPLHYNLTNLMFDKDLPSGQDHIITCEGLNEVGKSSISSAVTVLGQPDLLIAPNQFNCTNDCSPKQPHNFSCAFDTTYYADMTNIVLEQFWMFDGNDLRNPKDPELRKYFKIEADGTLILSTVDDSEMNKRLEKAVFTCFFRLVHPDNPALIIYSSDQDANLANRLSVSVHLNNISPAVASLNWIIPVIIVLIVLILIFLLICCLVRRPKGEAYNVDSKERAQGNDPIKEIKEKETFLAYERPEEPSMPARRMSVDASIGGSDDDGELDVYAGDTSKFNEEGSFIGEYANDKKSSKPQLESEF